MYRYIQCYVSQYQAVSVKRIMLKQYPDVLCYQVHDAATVIDLHELFAVSGNYF